jgi:hypothetical protein
MKSYNKPSTYSGAHLITVVALIATVAFAPALVSATDKVVHEDRAELRIKDMHKQFKITAEQEALWTKVTQVMRDDAKTMDTLTQARIDRAKDMTAVDDLKSYGEITEAHADGIKHMTPVFADLYASMSDAQKKVADNFFRHGDHHGGHKKPAVK